MKKLTLVTLISSALSAGAFAGGGKDKIENTFADLDSDRNGYISQEESKDESVKDYFSKMDSDSDKKLSRDEFNSYLASNPKHFEDHVAQTASTSMANQGNQTAQSRSQTDPTVQATTESDSRNEYGMSTSGTNTTDSDWNADQEAEKDRSVVAQNDFEQNNDTATNRSSTMNSQRSNDMTAQNEFQRDNGDMTTRSSNSGSQQGGDVVAQNEFEMMDTDRDGQLSKAEASRSGVNDTFEDIDEDGDQLITRVEYTEYRQNKQFNYDEE